MHMRVLLTIVIVLASILISACQLPDMSGAAEAAGTPELTEAAAVLPEEPQPEATPVPTETPAEPVATAEPPTSPSEDSNFRRAQFRAMSFMSEGRMLVTLAVPGDLAERYPAILADEKYSCVPDANYPERLFCVGPVVEPGWQVINVLSPEDGRILTEVGFTVQPQP